MIEMKVAALAGYLRMRDRFLLFVARFGWFFSQRNDHKYEIILYNLLETLIWQVWWDKARKLIR